MALTRNQKSVPQAIKIAAASSAEVTSAASGSDNPAPSIPSASSA